MCWGEKRNERLKETKESKKKHTPLTTSRVDGLKYLESQTGAAFLISVRRVADLPSAASRWHNMNKVMLVEGHVSFVQPD